MLRTVTTQSGSVWLRMTIAPTFDFARVGLDIQHERDSMTAVFLPRAPHLLPLRFVSTIPFEIDASGTAIVASFVLTKGVEARFALGASTLIPRLLEYDGVRLHSEYAAATELRMDQSLAPETICKFRPEVSNNLMLLDLLHFSPTGAFVESSTTSLALMGCLEDKRMVNMYHAADLVRVVRFRCRPAGSPPGTRARCRLCLARTSAMQLMKLGWC